MVRDILDHPEYRDDIVAFVKENGGLDYAVERLDDYVNQAVKVLEVLPDSKEKELLVQLAYFTAKRIM
jgi:octaprenyl-diphosphate synthase